MGNVWEMYGTYGDLWEICGTIVDLIRNHHAFGNAFDVTNNGKMYIQQSYEIISSEYKILKMGM